MSPGTDRLAPVDREESLLDLLFFHRRTREVAKYLLESMKSREGVFTPKEMGSFVKQLEAGKLEGCPKLSKRNFYPGVLKRLEDMGLVARTTAFDQHTLKGVRVYRIQEQPTMGHRPTRPSFLYLAFVASELWNEEFFGAKRTEYG